MTLRRHPRHHSANKLVLQNRNVKKQITQELTLEPNQYENVRFLDKEYIQQGDTCERSYTPVKNGFLIIEEN